MPISRVDLLFADPNTLTQEGQRQFMLLFGKSLQATNNLTDVGTRATALANLIGSFVAWTPALAPTGAMTISASAVTLADYLAVGALCHVEASISFTTGGTPAPAITVTLPLAFKGSNTLFVNVTSFGSTGVASVQNSVASLAANSTTLTIYAGADSITNYSAGAHTVYLNFSYRIA